jgi:hypothetical protein
MNQTGEIQPVAAAAVWVAPQLQLRKAQSIAPVAKTSGGSPAKVSVSDQSSTAGVSLPPGISVEDAQKLEAYLAENLGVKLNFTVDESGKAVVEVVEAGTGQVIRRIPPEKVVLLGKTPIRHGAYYSMARRSALW